MTLWARSPEPCDELICAANYLTAEVLRNVTANNSATIGASCGTGTSIGSISCGGSKNGFTGHSVLSLTIIK